MVAVPAAIAIACRIIPTLAVEFPRRGERPRRLSVALAAAHLALELGAFLAVLYCRQLRRGLGRPVGAAPDLSLVGQGDSAAFFWPEAKNDLTAGCRRRSASENGAARRAADR